LPVSLDCPFVIATSVFSNVFFYEIPLYTKIEIYNVLSGYMLLVF
jgi:hypothetical protein